MKTIIYVVMLLFGTTLSFSQTSDHLTYLNAYNFDFNTIDKTSGYLGNLNLFFQLKNGKATSNWYVNAGLKN